MRKVLWSPEEDERLVRCISQYVHGSWNDIARKAGLDRCGKSCRRRWLNHLRPNLKRGKFSLDEIELIMQLHEAMGNRWSDIARQLKGRTDNDIKNLWNTQIKKKKLPQHKTITPSASPSTADKNRPIGSNDSTFPSIDNASTNYPTTSTSTGSTTSDLHWPRQEIYNDTILMPSMHDVQIMESYNDIENEANADKILDNMSTLDSSFSVFSTEGYIMATNIEKNASLSYSEPSNLSLQSQENSINQDSEEFFQNELSIESRVVDDEVSDSWLTKIVNNNNSSSSINNDFLERPTISTLELPTTILDTYKTNDIDFTGSLQSIVASCCHFPALMTDAPSVCIGERKNLSKPMIDNETRNCSNLQTSTSTQSSLANFIDMCDHGSHSELVHSDYNIVEIVNQNSFDNVAQNTMMNDDLTCGIHNPDQNHMIPSVVTIQDYVQNMAADESANNEPFLMRTDTFDFIDYIYPSQIENSIKQWEWDAMTPSLDWGNFMLP